jgi:thermostable 8-oxoguanine DNA glycosylase
MANIQNLKPKPFTKENAKEMGARCGKKKAENAKERVLMSEIYSQFIAEHKEELEESLRKVAMRGDASTVSLISELRKGTEGDKTEITAKVATTEMSREELYNFVFGEK